MPKENRRVKMTKALLNDSFLNYLNQKPISRITVKEICEAADVNRSTYYVYYTDPYDQLHQLEQNLLDGQKSLVDSIFQEGSDENRFPDVITQILYYYRDNKKTLQVLLGDYGDINVSYDLLSFFAGHVLNSHGLEKQSSPELLQEYIYYASGCLGLIQYWISQDCAESPEILAERILRLTGFIQ